MDSPNAIVLRKRNLAELEEKVAGIAKTFEVRVREHENAARSAYSRVRVRPNN